MFLAKVLALATSLSVVSASPASLDKKSADVLAFTPLMGWDSYNHYSCSPNQSIVESNAQALVDLGLRDVGYYYVITDCGWTLPDRTEDGSLTWNPELFPDGYINMGNFIHSLGLGFGVYEDAGIKTCMVGSPDQAGSLFHEQQDAETFQSWGADLLKYDNCYSDAAAGYPDADYTPEVSPAGRYKNMSDALNNLDRRIVLQICDWGVDFPSGWAPALGLSWRIANDIIPHWRTVPRILNQAVPQTNFASVGGWLDLDMLEVGNMVLTTPEEQTHFSLWAIIKSPLVIGAALKDTFTSIPESSLEILLNKDVIGYNQDSLGVAASFRRRWTEDAYEVWAGPLSDERMVVALINYGDSARQLTLDLPDVGVQKAGIVKDIWNNITTEDVLTSYTANVEAHGTMLLELGNMTKAGLYSVLDATTLHQMAIFSQVYGSSTSNYYNLTVNFPSAKTSTTIKINGTAYTLNAGASQLTVPITLQASNNNTIEISSSLVPDSIEITPPNSTLYYSTLFSLDGTATYTTCTQGYCLPVGAKLTDLSSSGSGSLNITSPESALSGTKLTNLYFCNNDIAFADSFEYGTNTRNMTLTVNGNIQRVELPLSGNTSELFSPANGWEDTGIFKVALYGWENGNNVLEVGNWLGDEGLVDDGADFVGLDVFW